MPSTVQQSSLSFRRRLPPHDFEMRFVIGTAIRIRCHERAIFELHRRVETATLVLSNGRAGVEHQAVVSEVEVESVFGFHAEERADARRRVGDRER